MKTIAACATIAILAASGCVPREAYQPPVANFAKATGALSEGVDKILGTRRSAVRIQRLRTATTSNMKQAWAAQRAGQAYRWKSDTLVSFLCEPRASNLGITASRDFVAGTSKALSALVEPPPEKTEERFKALFYNYDVNVVVHNRADEVYQACSADLSGYVQTVYNEEGRTESAEALGAAVTQMLDLLDKATNAALGEIDSARRAAAIRRWARDTENQEELRRSIDVTDRTLERGTVLPRHLATKAAADSYQKHMDAITALDITKISDCKPYLSRQFAAGEPHATTVEFQRCWRASWDQQQSSAEAAVVAAASYDVESDKVATSAVADLKKALTQISKLADDEIDAEEARAILTAALRIKTVAENLGKTATSEETEKKVKALFKAIRDAV